MIVRRDRKGIQKRGDEEPRRDSREQKQRAEVESQQKAKEGLPGTEKRAEEEWQATGRAERERDK